MMIASRPRTSRALSQVSVSPLFALLGEAARLKSEGRPVLSLSAGEPDFDTPAHVRLAASEAMQAGQTRYTAVSGTAALKAAIMDKLRRDNRLDYAADEVIATTGAKQALFNFCLAVLDPGDEVIIPAPYWPSYVDMVRLAGAREVIVSTKSEDGFLLNAAALRGAISARTRAVFLNSPGNPSGARYEARDWMKLARVLDEHPEILIISDEIYEHISFSDSPFVGLLNAAPALRKRTVLVNGVSKAYAMTGWRIGFAAGPRDLIQAMEAVQSHSTSNPCSIAQAAAVAALSGDQSSVREMAQVFRQRHDRLLDKLRAIPGLRCSPAGGAFYLMLDVSGLIAALNQKRSPGEPLLDDVGLSRWLLEEYDLALASGTWFGAPGFLRCSFAASDNVLDEAVHRIARACEAAGCQ